MKRKVTWFGLSLLLVAAMLLASCSTSTTTSSQTSATTIAATTTSAAASGTTVLTVTEGSTVKTYSMADLKALPSVSGNGGYMGQGGAITGPFAYQGVALTTLLNAVGGISEGDTVNFTSSDNYTQSLTYDQISNGTLNYYDTTGNPINPSPKPTLTVIYSENGTALDSAHGPTELGALSSQNILTDGSLWARMVVSITVTSAAAATTTTMTNMATTTTTATSSTSTTTTMAVATTTTAPPVVVSTTPVATTPVILTVVNGSQKTTFSLAQLQQLQVMFAQSASIGKSNTISGPDSYVGVQVSTLLAAVGGFTSSNTVTFTGSDGYSKTFSYAAVENGTGITVEDNNGNVIASPVAPVMFLAYSKDGAALDSSTGPLELCFASSLPLNQYTTSSNWVKLIVTITIN